MTSAHPDNSSAGSIDPFERGEPKGEAGEGTRLKNDGLGQVLRDAYRDALEEGVPEDMLDLLRKLD